MANLTVHVLFRFSKKTGKVDMTMTALGSAQLKLWALNNTPKTKACIIVERDSGQVISIIKGTEDFPEIEDCKSQYLGFCEAYGIPMDTLKEIKDDRFDEEDL